MADENRDHRTEDKSKEESKQSQPTESGTAAATKTVQDEDDVQAYGEPSDGSGGTKGGA
jgi:hypothetical protein